MPTNLTPAKMTAAGVTAVAKIAAKSAHVATRVARVVISLIPAEDGRTVPGLRLTATDKYTVAVVRVPLAMTDAEVEPYLGSSWTLDTAELKMWGSVIKAGLCISPDTTPEVLVVTSGAVTLSAPNVESTRPWLPDIDRLVDRVMRAARHGRDRTADQLLVIDPKRLADVLNMAGSVSRGGVIVHPGAEAGAGLSVEQASTVVIGGAVWWSATASMRVDDAGIAASRTW